MALAAILSAMAVPVAHADVTPRQALFENGSFSEFDQTNAVAGVLDNITTRAYDGTRSAHSTYEGGGTNAYARGVWNVSWQDGDEIW
jgi:hypothetical protein